MGAIIAYVLKNSALLVGIIEAILKAVGGIVSMTPTKKDDEVVDKIDEVFSKIKAYLYTASDSKV
jgi:ArsR family metal-binding transcriptional regulator